MPIRNAPNTNLQYALVVFDDEGRERPESDGSLLSDAICARLQSPAGPVTDIFLLSHGWKGDINAAIDQCNRWIGAMVEVKSDLALARELVPGFSPLIVALHWPSLCFGDENVPESKPNLLLSGDAEGPSLEAQVDAFARQVRDTPAARAAIRMILLAAKNAPAGSPSDALLSAYDSLFRESGLRTGGVDAPPGADQDGFDAERTIEQARSNAPPQRAASPEAGLLDVGQRLRDVLLAPLRQLSFWSMKDRARAFGESGGHALLIQLQRRAPRARIHLMGHSFGCIVVSATVAGPVNGEPILRAVDTLFLVQGALSLWSFAPNIPYGAAAGYFHRILAERLVRGPIVTTRSSKDTAVGYYYPLGARVASQYVLGESFPKYGGVGTFGIRGVPSAEDQRLKTVQALYAFREGGVYNLEASDIIRSGDGASGAHSDIAHPEVAHAFWSAALAGPVDGALRPTVTTLEIDRGGLLNIDAAEKRPTSEAKPSADQPEERWFNAELEDQPAELAVGAWYVLAVDVDIQQRARAATANVPDIALPDGIDEITLTVQLDSVDFDIGDSTRPLRLPRSGRSRGKARFDLAPRHEGPSVVKITIHRDGNFVQQLELTYAVGVAQTPLARVDTAGRPASAAAVLGPRDAGLLLKPSPGGGYDCTVWAGGHFDTQLPIEKDYLSDAIDVLRQDLMNVVTYQNAAGEPIFQSAVDIPAPDRDAALKIMARAGALLFQKLFYGPAAGADARSVGDWLQRIAGDHKRPLKLQILSRTAPVPWQLLYVGDVSAPLDWRHFLGMSHIIEQIPFQRNLDKCEPEIPTDQPELAISINLNMNIDRDIPGKLVTRQTAFWNDTARARKRVKLTSRSLGAEVVKALSDASTADQIVYLYCHAASSNLTDRGGPGASSLQLTDGLLKLSDLSLDAPTKITLPGRPLVFINACESAELSPMFYDGFAPYFMAKGARGVIGTECKTPALFAAAWAEKFFGRFLDGETIGGAFLNLRQEFLSEHANPLGLLYAVHCDGDTRINPALALELPN
jgi:CHAT domain